MVYPPGLVAPTVALPPGYGLRASHPGDEPAWIALLNANGELGHWNHHRLARDTEGAVPGAIFFATHGGELAATAGVYDRRLHGQPAWEIGWVVRHPAYRGSGLGRAVTAAAVAAALDMPLRPIFLQTDDHRLTAIALYLGLGFEPRLRGDRSFEKRWRRVRKAIAARGPAGSSERHACT